MKARLSRSFGLLPKGSAYLILNQYDGLYKGSRDFEPLIVAEQQQEVQNLCTIRKKNG